MESECQLTSSHLHQYFLLMKWRHIWQLLQQVVPPDRGMQEWLTNLTSFSCHETSHRDCVVVHMCFCFCFQSHQEISCPLIYLLSKMFSLEFPLVCFSWPLTKRNTEKAIAYIKALKKKQLVTDLYNKDSKNQH